MIPDKMLLSDEEIKQSQVDARPGGDWVGDCTWREKAVAAAQLAKCNREWAKWMKAHEEFITAGKNKTSICLTMPNADYEALQKLAV